MPIQIPLKIPREDELKILEYWWDSDQLLRENFTKTWLKVKDVIVTATQHRSKIIFQSGNVLSDVSYIKKTHSLHIHNSSKLELFTETSDLQ